MGNIDEMSTWEEYVRRIETGDPVAGGANAPVNLALQDLANRTLYLKALAEETLSDLAAIAALVGDTSMGDVLLKANNLSDLPNKATARENLGVSAANHTHGVYLSKASNLSDLENPLTGRLNLGVSDILFGSGVPSVSEGKNGDLYIRTDIYYISIYKKSAGAWALIMSNTDIPGNAATATLAALATTAQSCSGNSATADKLKTARRLNGINFNGDSDVVVPPHSAISLNTNGYIRMQGSGLMVQWGRTSASVGGDSTLQVSFPIAFPNACFAISALILTSYMHTTSEGAVTAAAITTTGFVMVNGADSGGPVSFIAIGY